MFDTIKNSKSMNTAIRYIDSCENMGHIKSMEKYINLYHSKYDDSLGKIQLINKLHEKIQTLKTYKNE